MSHVVSLSCEPSPHALAELALLGSIAGRGNLTSPLSGPGLQAVWSANRTLHRRWMAELTRIDSQRPTGLRPLEVVGLELFLTELLTRVWATNWTIQDRALHQTDVERVMRNSLNGLARVRKEVLMLMVRHWQGPSAELVSRLDRFRRRCERWTDLLIAGPASQQGVWDFAVETERAKDFGEESWSRVAGEANPVSLLVSAGLRVMFGTPFPKGCCQHDCFAELIAATLATLPATAFHEDGTLKPAGEWVADGGL